MTPGARLQIGSLFLAYGAAGLFWGTLAASAPALQARAGLGEGGFGLAMGAMALTAVPVMRTLGPRLHRVEARAIPGAFLVFTLGAALIGTATGAAWLVLGLVVAGGASGAMDIALNNRTARVETDTGARLFNRTHALFPAAMLGSSAAAGALRGAGVPLWALFAAVALAFLAAAAVESRAGGHIRPARASAAPPPRMALAGPLLLLAAVAATGAFQEASSLAWGAIFVERVREAGAAAAGLAPAAFTLGLSAGRLAAHAVELRLSGVATMRAAALLAGPAFLLVASPAPLPVLLAAFFLAGMGVGPIEPAVFRAVARRAEGADRGRALASVTAIAYVGYLLSPPLLGALAELLGWTALWSAVAALSGLALLLALRLRA